MATRQYNIALGEHEDDVAEQVGGAITSGFVEVTLDLAVTGVTEQDVIIALDDIVNRITGIWYCLPYIGEIRAIHR